MHREKGGTALSTGDTWLGDGTMTRVGRLPQACADRRERMHPGGLPSIGQAPPSHTFLGAVVLNWGKFTPILGILFWAMSENTGAADI